jgi:hypothetical protein
MLPRQRRETHTVRALKAPVLQRADPLAGLDLACPEQDHGHDVVILHRLSMTGRSAAFSFPALTGRGRKITPGAVGVSAHPGTAGRNSCTHQDSQQAPCPKPGRDTISNRTSRTLSD